MEQLNMFGQTSLEDKVNRAIDRLKTFEPPEGYYLAFSGGKDSLCVYHLAKEAGVKFDAHYSLTTVDPPELVYFIKNNYPDVEIIKPPLSMWQLIVRKKMPPTRMVRYCCQILKENGGIGRIVLTGVRWDESNKRKNNRAAYEIITKSQSRKMLMNDNDEANKRIVNAIIDWADEDVWGFIESRNLKYCSLYDEGFDRLGCIGCPMAGQIGREREFARWPTYKRAYIRSFEKLAKYRNENGMNEGKTYWDTGENIFNWWMEYTPPPPEIMDGQIEMDEYD
jgi:phosphoadenosine phosphosulfate reductase